VIRFIPHPEPRLGPREPTDEETREQAAHLQRIIDMAENKLREVRGQIDTRSPNEQGVIHA
jgi:hypothetical protein